MSDPIRTKRRGEERKGEKKKVEWKRGEEGEREGGKSEKGERGVLTVTKVSCPESHRMGWAGLGWGWGWAGAGWLTEG